MKALIRHRSGYCEKSEIPYPPPPVLKYAEYTRVSCAWSEGMATPKVTPYKVKQFYLHKIELDPNTYWPTAIYTENNMAITEPTPHGWINQYYNRLMSGSLRHCTTSTCSSDETNSSLSKSKPTEKSMYNLTNIAKRLLNKDIKTLVKAGFMNSDLSMTEAGRQELTSILFEKYQKELVEAATTRLEEEKEIK